MMFFSKTDIGKKRAENQDRVWAGTLAVVLCDGMGGENAGSRASQMTVDFISERLLSGFRDDIERKSVRNLVLSSLVTANTLVFEEALADPAKHGMGTTCVCAVVHNERAYIANVGDSRAYHIFDDGIQQLTKDHTYVRVLLEEGKITAAEARVHPGRNAITKAIGAESSLTPDWFEIDLHKDSILLLCSDGLHAYEDDAAIAEIVIANPKNKACDLLIDYALAKGGNDNITAALIINS
jgi:protein phosphatase